MVGYFIVKYLKYYKYLLIHKALVFYHCCRFGLFWRGLIHDYSKLLPYEAYHYANATFGKGRTPNYGLKDGMPDDSLHKTDPEFIKAVWYHKLHNSHHWENWISVLNKECYEIDRVSLIEMYCDWISANKQKNDFPSSLAWYTKNKDRIFLNKKSRRLIEYMLKKGL